MIDCFGYSGPAELEETLHIAADLTLPIRILDLEDVNAFIEAFLAGCPS
ncbi:MAG: hypothetical protein AAGI53_02630 [Planctomycetota bacterium]